ELEKYSQELFDKLRYLVINKIDLLADKVDQKCQEFVEQIGYQGNYYTISAAMKK
ncbi:GTPase ObgE, partial [Francisella tularensis subsp. holarctica]|nr:GTPase ObgE [Francisella tularensis subsp. holarctica]